MEPTLHVITVYLFEEIEYGLQFSFREMVNSYKSHLLLRAREKEILLPSTYIPSNICLYVDSPALTSPVPGRLPQG